MVVLSQRTPRGVTRGGARAPIVRWWVRGAVGDVLVGVGAGVPTNTSPTAPLRDFHPGPTARGYFYSQDELFAHPEPAPGIWKSVRSVLESFPKKKVDPVRAAAA